MLNSIANRKSLKVLPETSPVSVSIIELRVDSILDTSKPGNSSNVAIYKFITLLFWFWLYLGIYVYQSAHSICQSVLIPFIYSKVILKGEISMAQLLTFKFKVFLARNFFNGK